MMEVIVFPNTYERYQPLTIEDNIVVISGTLNFKEDEPPKILADSIAAISDYESSKQQMTTDNKKRSGSLIKIRLGNELTEKEDMDMIVQLLQKYSGNTPVIIYTPDGKAMKAAQNMWVDENSPILQEAADIVGKTNVKIQS